MTPQMPVDEPVPLDYEHEPEEDWYEDDPEEVPRRPRRKLFSPVPVALLVILLVACGFFAGVEVEKSNSSSSSSSGLAAGLSALRSRFGGTGTAARTGSTGTSGFPGAAGGGFAGGGFAGAGVTTGEVSYVSGDTLYVTSGENTVKVKVPSGTTVSKTVSTSVKSVHPGDTVVVRGSQGKNGSVTASSLSISSSGGSSTSSSTGASTGSGGSSSTPQLFGAG